MDRLPRKLFLVGGDVCNGIIYTAMGIWLFFFDFSYIGYLCISILLSCLHSIDQLAYDSLYPDLIPKGAEQKGYAVSSMLYPILNVLMAPIGALLLDLLGVALLLIIQGALSLIAALTEQFIRIDEGSAQHRERYTLSAWASDIREGFTYLKKEKGLRSIYEYMAVANGVAQGYSPILVAFFRTAPGFSATMYSLFSVAEFIGRSVGSFLQYRIKIPNRKKFGITFIIYQIYESMDICLLWLPYPLMLINRGFCGFLGNNSAILRKSAVQRYIPAHLRARVNALNEMIMMIMGSLLSLAVGALGEVLDYRLCVTLCGVTAMLTCWLLIWCRRKDVGKVYEADEDAPAVSST